MAETLIQGGRQGSPPNIVIITLDCVRPDFLGCYGCRTVRTPHLDRMAARGLVFDQAVSQAPNTWVSHAGIFTGCYPPVHGLRSPYDRILPEVPTLASMLKARGYHTAGFPGNDLVGSRMGFGTGFDLFFEEYRKAEDPDPVPGTSFTGAAPAPGDPCTVTANTRNDWEDVLEAAEQWFAGRNGPVFAWFHYLDTHHMPDLQLPDYYRFSRDPLWQFYEGKVSYSDERCVGALLEMLRRHGLYEETLLVILSDHGEGLRPGYPPAHNGELTEEVIHVPLILFGEQMPFRGARVPVTTRTADLTPTLAALAGCGEDADFQRFSGSTLPLPGLPGLAGSGERLGGHFAYAENEPLGLACIRTGEWKFLARGGEEALFHMSSDPGEQVNVILQHPETAGSLREDMNRVRSQ